jgi:hypothetical protein
MNNKSLIDNLEILRGSHVESNENIRACIVDEAIQVIKHLESKLTNIKSAWINLTEYESCDTMVITLKSYEKLQAAIEGKV